MKDPNYNVNEYRQAPITGYLSFLNPAGGVHKKMSDTTETVLVYLCGLAALSAIYFYS